MHAVEKILAGHSGKRSVQTGEIVTAKVDFAEINDLYRASRSAAFHPKAVRGHFGNPALASR